MEANLLNNLTIEDLIEPYKTIAELIGMDAVVIMAQHFGGSQVYFQQIDTVVDSLKERLIRQEFNGYNYEELARKYQCSTRWVRKLVSDIQQKVRNRPGEGQLSLFDIE